VPNPKQQVLGWRICALSDFPANEKSRGAFPTALFVDAPKTAPRRDARTMQQMRCCWRGFPMMVSPMKHFLLMFAAVISVTSDATLPPPKGSESISMVLVYRVQQL